MSEERYVAIDDDEVYYITDTKGLTTLYDYVKEFSKEEYEFTKEEALSAAKEEYWEMIYENSMTATENVNKLNHYETENKKLKELVSEVDNEFEIRDTVCRAGKFRLEEWGKHRYHQFFKGDEELEDESVVIMLMELEKENKELKKLVRELTKNTTW